MMRGMNARTTLPLWLFPVAYLIHVTEEFFGGAGLSLAPHRMRGFNMTPVQFIVANCAALVLLLFGLYIARRRGFPHLLLIIIGSVFLVRETDEVARLRLLLVEPSARGLGIGARLVEEALRFAREARYRTVTLWTHSVLAAARHIYERAGFRLMETNKHNEFGRTLVGETWKLELEKHQQR